MDTYADWEQPAFEGLGPPVNLLAELLLDDTARLPVPKGAPPATVRGHDMFEWRVHPALSIELPESEVAFQQLPNGSRWLTHRVAEQVVGVTSTGMELALAVADVRALKPPTGKALLVGVRARGFMEQQGSPKPVQEGNGLTTPIIIDLGQPVDGVSQLRFQAQTLAELEDVASMPDLFIRFESLLDIADAYELLDKLCSSTPTLPTSAKVPDDGLVRFPQEQLAAGVPYPK